MNAVLFASAIAAAVSLLLTLVTDLSVLRVSRRRDYTGPTPGISSSELAPVRTLARRARMPVIAKR